MSTVNQRLVQLEQHVSLLEAKLGDLELRENDHHRVLLTLLNTLAEELRQPRTSWQRLKALWSHSVLWDRLK